MGQLFRCQYCGAHNTIGQRFCSGCGIPFYYTCTTCNSQVDPSFKFCPNCSISLKWTIKPRVNLFPRPAREPMPRYKIILLTVATILLISLTTWGYLSYRSSLETPLVFTGYESSQELVAESERIVTAPIDSQYTGNPPYNIGAGAPFNLKNNASAANVSFKELKAFIFEDKTDEQLYMWGTKMCGYFAQTVHNNAEKAGIKAGVAIISFQGETMLHAINAFQTTDKGLIYIDCTGTRGSPSGFEEWLFSIVYPLGQDRMAYVSPGKTYGTIPLEDAESPEYSFFAGYRKSWTMDRIFFFSQPTVVKSVTTYW